jgi:hypothetical protein
VASRTWKRSWNKACPFRAEAPFEGFLGPEAFRRQVAERWLGKGVISALSILSGACRAASRLPKGFEKNATTLLAGTQLSRVISIGVAAVSSERAALVAARKSPYE